VEAARELAMRIDWYHNSQTYIKAANEILPALAKINGTQSLREDIVNRINNKKPFDIDAVKQYLADARNGKTADTTKLFSFTE
jgi:hypothetical protein